MSSSLYNGLAMPTIGATQPVPVPLPNKITFFARDNQTLWVKFSDSTEILVCVG
jgi:hypothetical protein